MLFTLALALCLTTGAPAAETAPEGYLAIATGTVDGVYYPVGRALCASLMEAEPDIHCAALPTLGAATNLELLQSGEAQMAIIQGDMVKGSGRAARDLAVVAGLHEEYLTVLAPPGLRLGHVSALPPGRLRSGPNGSGHRHTGLELATALGLKAPLAQPWNGRDIAAPEFCAGEAFALLLMTGHPAGNVQELVLNCGAHILGLDAFTITRIRQRDPGFRASVIPAHSYRGQDRAIPTVSRQALLVARRDLPPALVTGLLRAVLADFDSFTASHPALRDLTPARFQTPRAQAPRHPAAMLDVTLHGQGQP